MMMSCLAMDGANPEASMSKKGVWKKYFVQGTEETPRTKTTYLPHHVVEGGGARTKMTDLLLTRGEGHKKTTCTWRVSGLRRPDPEGVVKFVIDILSVRMIQHTAKQSHLYTV